MKRAELIVRSVCWLVLAILVVKLLIYHCTLVVYPFPNEYREGAMMTTTQGLLHGVNPFALKNQPQYMNDYGGFYSIVTYPFAKIFGVTLLVHRTVTAFFILACCGLMFWVMRRLKVDMLLSVVAIAFFYAFSLYPTTTTPLVNPSSLGLFIFLTALFVPWAKGFSYSALLLSAVLGILGYYTKPYFLLSVPLLAIYLFFFVSKRKSIAYFLVFASMAAVSVYFVNKWADCYFANCFFLHLNPGHLSWGQSVRQFKEFVFLNRMVLISAGIVLVAQMYLARKDWKVRLWPMNARPLSFILYCTIFCSVILFFWLGKHEEAYLWYYFHLLSPFLLICMAFVLSRKLPWTVILVPLLLWNLWSVTSLHDKVKFDFHDEGWRKVEALISAHKDIVNSPLIAPLLIQHGLPVYDNGLSEYVKKGGYRETALSQLFSKGDPRVILRYYIFMNEMRKRIQNREFDLAMVVYNYAPQVPGELNQYYRPLGLITLKTPAIFGEWQLTVWVPNDK